MRSRYQSWHTHSNYSQGTHFFYKTNGTEFFMKGIAYQQEPPVNGTSDANTSINDPLADTERCLADIPYLVQLGTNIIRVYAIDPKKDHSTCMSALADAGIYVIQDLSNPKNSIIRDAPEWTTDLFAGYAAVIDEMAQYTNTFGFFAGNEVSNQINNTAASAYVKAAVRDSKAYIKTKGYRELGVGYATNDDPEIRDPLANYFNCGPVEEAIDFWGYNIYSWCGKSTFTESGFDKRTEEFRNYTVPVFLAEYGCNEPNPRIFTEVEAIYGPNMTDVWSGGIVYMYFQEANDYGLVKLENGKISKLPDFNNLATQIAAVEPTNVKMSDYKVTNTAVRECPAVNSEWEASEVLPPIANAELCDCMMASLECKAKKNIDVEDIGEQFSYVCGEDPESCVGILSNATTGEYGAYSMCSPSQKLSFAFNTWYLRNDKASDACDFSGNAETQKASVNAKCKPLVDAAGTDGAGTVKAIPTSGGSGSGSGSEDGDSEDPDSAAGNVRVGFAMGAWVVGALMVGAGMIVL